MSQKPLHDSPVLSRTVHVDPLSFKAASALQQPRTHTVPVRLNDEELRLLGELSELTGASPAATVRAAILAAHHATIEAPLRERAHLDLMLEGVNAAAQERVDELATWGLEPTVRGGGGGGGGSDGREGGSR